MEGGHPEGGGEKWRAGWARDREEEHCGAIVVRRTCLLLHLEVSTNFSVACFLAGRCSTTNQGDYHDNVRAVWPENL
jgi:hypothetical protein